MHIYIYTHIYERMDIENINEQKQNKHFSHVKLKIKNEKEN